MSITFDGADRTRVYCALTEMVTNDERTTRQALELAAGYPAGSPKRLEFLDRALAWSQSADHAAQLARRMVSTYTDPREVRP